MVPSPTSSSLREDCNSRPPYSRQRHFRSVAEFDVGKNTLGTPYQSVEVTRCQLWHDYSMRLETSGVGDAVIKILTNAIKVRVASAFFCPGSKTLDMLNAIEDLTLIISEEFTINDPAKLEKLTKANKRSVQPDSKDGKLHAKVIIAEMPDKSTWALIGSANMTEQGLFFNQEAGVSFTSNQPQDREVISETKEWFDSLLKRSRPLDLQQARAIWATKGKQKLTAASNSNIIAPSYWALKTTEGGGDQSTEHWPMFQREKVVAIGWETVAIDPSKVDDAQLRAAVHVAYPHNKPGADEFAARTIRDFVELPIDSIIMICRGYTPNQADDKPVHIYAFARVTEKFKAEPYVVGEWRFRRSVILQEVGKTLSVRTMRDLLKLGSLRQTMHEVPRESVEAIAAELGVQLAV